MTDVTRILNAIEQGEAKATDELLPLVYEELRSLAAQKLFHESPGQTLQATALVHEAYLRLIGGEPQTWDNRGHFFKAAAEAMRRILVDNARRKKSLKRGGNRQRVELDDSIVVGEHVMHLDDLLMLNDTLNKLGRQDQLAADLVKLRIFGGFSVKEAAELVRVSLSKAYADLEYGLAWLRREMCDVNLPGQD